MKSLEELRNSIYGKTNETGNFGSGDSKLSNGEGGYNYEESNAFPERNKKKNRMKAACMRMIENYPDGMHDGWKFYGKDYSAYADDLKGFG